MNSKESDKVKFRKEDMVRLDRLPSAMAPDAIVLKAPRKGILRRLAGWLAIVLLFLATLAGGLFLALENGFLDETLTAEATRALDGAVGPGLDASVATTRLRIADGMSLALEARNVVILDEATGKPVLSADAIRLALDPVALLAGSLSISRIDVGSAEVDARFFAGTQPLDWSKIRVDRVPALEDLAYQFADRIAARLEQTPTARFSLASLKLTLPAAYGLKVPLELRDSLFERVGTDVLEVSGQIVTGKVQSSLAFTIMLEDNKVARMDADLIGLDLGQFLLRPSKLYPGPLDGIDAPLSLSIKSRRAGDGAAGSLEAFAKLGKGQVWVDRVAQDLRGAEMHLQYDPSRQTIAFDRGDFRLGASRLPLEGAVIDLDRVDGEAEPGIALDLLVNNGIAAPEGSGEAPLVFNAKASAYYDFGTKHLSVTPISVSTRQGNLAATLGVKFGTASPEISFSIRTSEVASAVVKQLWPFWVAKPSRHWVHANMFAGKVSNGEIDVLIPAGSIGEGKQIILDENELSVRFDITGTRFNFLGDIPPARNAHGHFEQKGKRINVTMPSGDVYLHSGQSVKVTDAEMIIADIYEKPLMADIRLSAIGTARAVAELSTFRPVAALQKTEFKVEDFSGNVTATISARVGLVANQNPPKPEWQAKLDLENVSLVREIGGRTISNLGGTLEIGPKGLRLESDAKIDGVDFKLALSQALDDPKGEKRRFSLTGKLGRDGLAKFVPGLADFVDGRIAVRMEADNQGNQKVDADLSAATLSVPWIGWRKGAGIAAKSSFTAQTRDGVTKITGFQLNGDGFGAEGELVNDRNGLVSAKFARVQLSPSDRYQMSIRRGDSGLAIDVRGSVADLRPVINSLKANSGKSGKSAGSSLRVSMSLDKAVGYNKESISDVKVKLSTSDGRINTLSLSGITESGQAVVAKKDDGEKVIDITSGDAGALARFVDIYRNMRGGLLNIKLRARDADSWRGSVDVRNFALINEERLKSIVSTPVGDDGRSLNDAVRREIDVSSQKFKRAFARVLVDGAAIRIENGVVRGDQVGATFQGAVRDESGRMELTGTFMPAYGLNRLFAELPLIGVILGNGTDRGLLGITFKLSGPADDPKLSVNPLSLIAPGVFRNIFEFE
jgi:hypothetical protein